MKGQKRPNFKRRYIMRWLLSLIFVMVTLSSAFATETKTEYITEEVCHAVAGCWVDTKTGECPDCVTETRKVVTVIEDSEFKGVESIEPLPKVARKTVLPKMGKKCFFPELGWMHNGKSTGEYRDCGWKNRGSNTAAAVERGTIECGGFMNWTWIDEHHTEYICNKG